VLPAAPTAAAGGTPTSSLSSFLGGFTAAGEESLPGAESLQTPQAVHVPTHQPTLHQQMSRHRQATRHPTAAVTAAPTHTPPETLSFAKPVPEVTGSSRGLCKRKISLYCGNFHGDKCRTCVSDNWEELAFSCSSQVHRRGGGFVASACA
jgi:hypothetical protein